MAYKSMKKLITNQNGRYDNNEVTEEEYKLWKQNTMNKLDIFFTCSRLTESQYRELVSMLYFNDVTEGDTNEPVENI